MMDFHRGFITQERAGTGGSAPPVEIKSLQALVTEELGKKLENMGFTLQRIKNRQVIWNFRLLYGNIWEYMGIYIYTYRHMEFPPIITIYVELASSAMEHLGAISINCTVIGVGVSLQDGIVMHCKQLPIGIKL